MDLWLVGYGAWPASRRAEGLVEALRRRGVGRVVDVRLNPCASDPTPGRPHGPRPWHLQVGRAGIEAMLGAAGIVYTWLPELGNPQRKDPTMAVLRHQLAGPPARWPVHRGLDRLTAILGISPPVALLCACEDGMACHRTLIARALSVRDFGGRLAIREVVEPGSRPRALTAIDAPGPFD